MKPIIQYLQQHEYRNLLELNLLTEGDTGIQCYRIVELAHYGRCMVINDCIQSTEKDESFYHEALIFPGAMLHGHVKRIICFGGANGGVIKRLSWLPQLEAVVQIDVDEVLYHISRTYLPHMHPSTSPSFSFQLFFDHPIKWLKSNSQKYEKWADMIICDLPDATHDSYASQLFTKDFYQTIQKILSPSGIFVTQAGQGHVFDMSFHQKVIATLSSVFSSFKSYCQFVPSFGVPWAFALASDNVNLMNISPEILEHRIQQLPENNLISYDSVTHQHMFCLPKIFRQLLSKEEMIIQKDNLEFVQIREGDHQLGHHQSNIHQTNG